MKVISTLFLCAVLCFVGCGKSSSSSSSDLGSGSNTLFYAVKATTPAITATTSQAPGLQASVFSAPSITDQAMNVAFQLLRDYTYPDDEGKIDMSNIYKVLYEAGRYLDEAPLMCTTLVSAVTDSALSPYQFSDFLGHTYDCGGSQAESGGYGSSVAYKTNGTNKYMLASYKWAPDAAQQIAIGVIQAMYNDTTKDVELIFAQAVNYPAGSTMGGTGGSGFGTRARIVGNSGTHAFELKMLTENASLVGKGISQGAGNSFLIRSDTNYYCLPAGATETDLAGITPTDLAGVSGGDCAAYAADVSAATPYDVSTDLPNIDLSDFNRGVSGTPVHYQMF